MFDSHVSGNSAKYERVKHMEKRQLRRVDSRTLAAKVLRRIAENTGRAVVRHNRTRAEDRRIRALVQLLSGKA